MKEFFKVRRKNTSKSSKRPFKILREAKRGKKSSSMFGNKGLKVLTVEMIKFFHRNKDRDLPLDYVAE